MRQKRIALKRINVPAINKSIILIITLNSKFTPDFKKLTGQIKDKSTIKLGLQPMPMGFKMTSGNPEMLNDI